MDNVPVNVFVALAANENANCWLQARTFTENSIGDPFRQQWVKETALSSLSYRRVTFLEIDSFSNSEPRHW